MFDQPIFIVSPPRSGSSLLSNIIHDAGAFGGTMKPADKYNANGYFENIAITQLVIQYLRRCDIDRKGKRYNPISLQKPYPDLRYRIQRILFFEGYNQDRPWFFKDPKLCFVWPVFNYAFPNARWVIVDRPEADCISSFMRTPFMDAYNNVQDWRKYYARLKQNIELLERSVLHSHRTNINKIIARDEHEIAKLENYLTFPILKTDCIDNNAWGRPK